GGARATAKRPRRRRWPPPPSRSTPARASAYSTKSGVALGARARRALEKAHRPAGRGAAGAAVAVLERDAVGEAPGRHFAQPGEDREGVPDAAGPAVTAVGVGAAAGAGG